MKSKLDKALSLVALGVLGVLNSAHAAPVYEIVNIDNFDLLGTLEGTRNGYALSVNANDELVGISKGKKKLSTTDIENDVIDFDDGISPSETITYSINSAIIANNFTFIAAQNGAAGAWLPTFDSINGTTAPKDTNADVPESINSVDSFYYGINDAGIKVGAMTAPEQKVEYTGTSENQDYWYYREYESRGVAKTATAEIPLLPPYTQYVKDDKTALVGGWSTASKVNNNNLVVGYASTAISSYGAERMNYCLGTDNTLPLDVCIQAEQYPNSVGARNVQYQIRSYIWKIENDAVVATTELPLGLTPASDNTLTFTAQALGVNNNDVVVGRSHVYRDGDTDRLRQDSAYWSKNAQGVYEYHWIPMRNDDIISSIAYDINDSGIVVGSYNSYIQGYRRDKFFYFDINTPETTFVTPKDFLAGVSDLSSKPKDINNKGQVVGSIEATYDKEKPRPKVGFLFDKTTEEFSDVNKLLTCESKGYEKGSDGNWTRHPIEVVDGSGKVLTYNSDIVVVENNSINEEGTIVGTAFIRKPSYQFDDDGNIVTNDAGLPLFELNGNGEPVTAYIPRMVVLKPSANGVACDVVDSTDDDANYERQGAASFAWLFALPLLWLRRRVR